jgi:hypothetical protein
MKYHGLMNIVTRIKKWFIRLFVLVRKKLRAIEAKLDVIQPHPVVGALIIVASVILILAGIAMLVLPGPGMLVLALGIVCMIVGTKAVRGQYGPDRVKRERAEKHRRLAHRRKQRRKSERAKQADTPFKKASVEGSAK